jgi:CheY-like chemotaxis protein
LFAGRKLLVADDSPYYRTVIGLTFTDEGMEVATAGDGQEALEKLEQFTPDVILAHAAMPGISGYELCELIKTSERFGHIPVMLLVGQHEPFDQAEARRVGADDIVAKPFKSIRQLVSRVGSLLGGSAETPTREYSTLGLEPSDAPQPAAPDNHPMADTNVKVFIEAPSMTESEPIEPAVEEGRSTCVADAELQTADTRRLEPIGAEPAVAEEPISYVQDDTIEMEPAMQTDEKLDSPIDSGPDENISSIGAPEMSEKPGPQTETAPVPNEAVFNDALLDLGDFDSETHILVAEDLVLDLDYEEPASGSVVTIAETIPEATLETEAAAPADAFAPEPTQVAPEPTHEEQHVAEFQEWAIIAEAPAEAPLPVSVAEDQASTDSKSSLSPEAIDAIARRAVELMSDKVVREIAWEVVPELAELLIKKKLEEQNH